jgi:tRNA pseudouridine38-40 synthase
MKFKLVIAYDGANYEGWQTQKIGTGVQQIIEGALAKLFPGKPALHGSSRTDTGVHALGMVAHFQIPPEQFRMPLRKLLLALNAWLPEDIRVLAASRVPDNFNARFDATGKQYRYFIWNHAAMNPLERRNAWHVPVKLDFKKMQAAAKLFVGKHDFQSFAANPGYKKESTVRTITRCDVKKTGPHFTVIIEGDGFLYKMCRGIAGTIVQCASGKFPPEQIKTMLAQKDRRVAGMTAPAHGLVLWKVYYPRK